MCKLCSCSWNCLNIRVSIMWCSWRQHPQKFICVISPSTSVISHMLQLSRACIDADAKHANAAQVQETSVGVSTLVKDAIVSAFIHSPLYCDSHRTAPSHQTQTDTVFCFATSISRTHVSIGCWKSLRKLVIDAVSVTFSLTLSIYVFVYSESHSRQSTHTSCSPSCAVVH